MILMDRFQLINNLHQDIQQRYLSGRENYTVIM